MKYWILTTDYISKKNEEIAVYVREHTQTFAARGYEVLIIQGGEGCTDERTTISNNIRLHSFSLNGRNSTSFLGYQSALSFEFANEVINLLADNTPDVIEVQEYLGIGYYLLMRKYAGEPLLKNIPVIVTAHMPSFITNEYDHISTFRFPAFWTAEMEKFSLLAADLVLFPGNYLVGLLKERMPEAFPDNYRHVPYPFIPKQPVAGAVIEKGTILVSGKMSYSKGALKLLQEASRLWKKGINFTIKWVGDTSDYLDTEGQSIGDFIQNKYQEYIASGKLSITNNATPEEKSQLLAAAHAVLIPSLADNLPYAAIEAMAAGKTVLASSGGGQAEVITDGVSGYIFDWDQPGSFENKLNAVLSLQEEELLQIGKNAAAAITICSREQYYATKNNIISDVIRSYQPKTKYPVIRPQPRHQYTSAAFEEALTIVIPYYNMGAFIEECLESIYAGLYKHIRVFIIDDGSTEESSVAKLTDIKKQYPQITVIHQENAGLSATRNTGLKYATTKYISFLDADDTVEKTYFYKAINILNQYENISFVSCWMRYFGADTGTWPGQNPEVPYLLFHNTVHSGCVFKTSDILQTGGYDSSLVYGMEDYEMAVHMVSKGFHGVSIPEVLYNYRIRKQSMARAFTDNKKLYLYWLISNKHKALFDKYGYESVNILNANGPGYLHDNPTFQSRLSIQTVTPPNYWKLLANDILNKHPKLRKSYTVLAGLLKRIF